MTPTPHRPETDGTDSKRGAGRRYLWPLALALVTSFFGVLAFGGRAQGHQALVLFFLFLVLLVLSLVFSRGGDEG